MPYAGTSSKRLRRQGLGTTSMSYVCPWSARTRSLFLTLSAFFRRSACSFARVTIKDRSKGLTEQGPTRLGYKDMIILRPAALAQAERPEKRPAESMITCV